MAGDLDAERWQRLQELFYAALELEASARPAFIDQQCSGDADLRQRALDLLRANDKAEGRFESVIRHTLALAADEVGSQGLKEIGPYRVLSELGHGGLSTVYLAERADQHFHMRVAIKVVRQGMDTDDILRRLRQERQILASLDHPNIARLFDGGTTEEGLPYFVMEYIEGEPIDSFCDRRRLPVRRRLELFAQVCSAVDFAHRSLVIHRDLKPSNILVTANGTPKLLDFGIAKVLRAEASNEPLDPTAPGLRMLTPRYASPEQIRGLPLTTATDVYSLGVLLYQLLTGRLPYDLTTRDPSQLERLICEVEPRRPSATVDGTTGESPGEAEGPQPAIPTAASSPAKLRRQLSGDLDNIILTSLRKETDRRYGSVEQLAEDLRRHLSGLPVLARPDTVGYRLQKFTRRHSAGVTAVATLVAVVTSLVVFFTARLAAERDQAQKVARQKTAVVDFLVGIFKHADPEQARGEQLSARQILDRGIEGIDELADQPDIQVQLLTVSGDIYFNIVALEEAERVWRAALSLQRKRFAENSLEVANARVQVALVLARQGDSEAARDIFEEALPILQRHAAAAPRSFVLALSNLGAILFSVGELGEAERLVRDAFLRQTELLGPTHPDTVTSENNLGIILQEQGKLDQAEKLLRKGLRVKVEVFDQDHPDVAVAYQNLGRLLAERGKHEEARTHLLAALELKSRLYGRQHQKTIGTSHTLAKVCQALGQQQRAEELYRLVLGWHRAHRPPASWTAGLLTDFGGFLTAKGTLKEAVELLEEAVALLAAAGMEGSLEQALADAALGQARCWQGDAEEARRSLEASLPVLRHHLGSTAPRTQRVAAALAAPCDDSH